MYSSIFIPYWYYSGHTGCTSRTIEPAQRYDEFIVGHKDREKRMNQYCSISQVWETMVSASGKRGLITHLNGIGRLYDGREYYEDWMDIMCAHSIRPSLMKPSLSGIIGFPWSSSTGLIVVAHNKRAIVINIELFATCRPGHSLCSIMWTIDGRIYDEVLPAPKTLNIPVSMNKQQKIAAQLLEDAHISDMT